MLYNIFVELYFKGVMSLVIKFNGKKYHFTPNLNTFYIACALILSVIFIFSLHSCTKYNRSIRGDRYEEVLVEHPIRQLRPCAAPDGTPTADYFSIYPPKEGDKVIYLTFDDGPSANVTPQILDVLKKYRVKATFFVLGYQAEKYPDILKRIGDEGHAIGNHSYSHNYAYIYSSPQALLDELNKTRDIIVSIAGESAYAGVMRFPGGAFRNEKQEFKNLLLENQIPYCNWNCLNGDSETTAPIASDLISRAKRSASGVSGTSLVMLMHDAGAKQATVDALPNIIEHFKAEGYRFDTVRRK